LQRVWKRFDLGQSKIRTALSARCPPPELPARLPTEPAHRPAAQVLAHLQAAFPDADCPIAAFQLAMHTFFVCQVALKTSQQVALENQPP
jgi:hypothetical protein